MESRTVHTTLFDYRDPKPHFINPNCFGEDFAAWLRERVAQFATDGFDISAPIQEDYGWGCWLTRGKDTFWVAVGLVDRLDGERGAEWVVSIDYDPGLSLVRRLFHKPDQAALEPIRAAVREALRTTAGIQMVPEGEEP